MADQCIVCLEDLDTVDDDPEQVVHQEYGEDPQFLTFDDNNNHKSQPNGQHVARIESCGHVLHDICLNEWTSKANSCPICRTTFNLVQVFEKVGGQSLLTRLSRSYYFLHTLLTTLQVPYYQNEQFETRSRWRTSTLQHS